MAFLGETDTYFPWETFHWDHTVRKLSVDSDHKLQLLKQDKPKLRFEPSAAVSSAFKRSVLQLGQPISCMCIENLKMGRIGYITVSEADLNWFLLSTKTYRTDVGHPGRNQRGQVWSGFNVPHVLRKEMCKTQPFLSRGSDSRWANM